MNKTYTNFKELTKTRYMTPDPILKDEYYYAIEPLTLQLTWPHTQITITQIDTISIETQPITPPGTQTQSTKYTFYASSEYNNHETEIIINNNETIKWTILNAPLCTRQEYLEYKCYTELSDELFLANTLEEYRQAIKKFHKQIKEGDYKKWTLKNY